MAEEKLNIFQKLTKARAELGKIDLKKSGHNSYSNYDYFELSDFLPHINRINNDLGIIAIFQYSNDEAILKIVNVDDPEDFIPFPTPIEVANLKECSGIQNIGASQKFARRYCYQMAYEISEADNIDGGQVDMDKEEAKKKISKASVLTIKNLITETNVNIADFLEWAGVVKIEDITNAALGNCINMLNKKKELLEKSKKQQEAHQRELQQHQEDFQF